MSLQLFLDNALTQPISLGDLSNPDRDEFNGTSGETKDRELFLANEQNTLSAALTSSATTVSLTKAAFANGTTLRIGSEEMTVQSGGGTTTITVTRGANNTTAAAHASGDTVFTSFDSKDLTIAPIDSNGSDETSWVSLALTQAGLSSATAGSELVLGDKTYDQTLSFWRRVVVPAGTPVQNKTDLRLQVSGTLYPVV